MGQWLHAKEAAESIRRSIAENAGRIREQQGTEIKMAVVLVEGDPASLAYAKAKQRWAARLGIGFDWVRLNPDVTEEELIMRIHALNSDVTVHGILLELPLPHHLSARTVIEKIAPWKDVDGLTSGNRMANQTGAPGLYPATPLSCVRLLEHYGYALEGKHAVVVGRGETVGMPLLHLLLRNNATVTVCHSRTPDLSVPLRQADFLFAAAGRRGLISEELVHPNLVAIDAGINETEDGQLAGDIALEAIGSLKAMSPVPGGVGTLTTAILFENLLKAYEMQQGQERLPK
ncbi:bifunctional 5,10-methylenetetrahydrofolate dehydrogenase/5,10-methenyltetrahydrofolate cyclohydrolase [Paenibacillus sp. J2TS4]|uniref:bifunctional 5,10-methylenetetrahydrofolate dehydrogenase/5,10-methenyltetrahydrofolate cyclohydrolase n=1 Tax=Paenibacillus sp. J2TS4 TaxID=2807194 RepID=UPI001B122482|nr:bifunctional 5,10-methylenetetrahydrofolate dehydrogenase/5,10-methenyltetrahydrofolate cyclohydrolase [Paenibacillus sp. J2TS4]GIP35268.1 bifunctional 5,10-methylene-tetrahydrofolate dehydrogenase/5,10-methylene-tetrahydrofolate cyclohydrolase [Paenibacillus sp. J2TS4]